MGNFKRYAVFVLALLLLLPFVPQKANAAKGDTFKELNIFVNILENGDARIRENWIVYNGDSGTEWYKPMNNLNNMDIKDFFVLFEGKEGENRGENWNPNGDFDSKAYSYGINKLGPKNYELCFGKSRRGPFTYTLSYTYTNFVENFKESADNEGYVSGFIVKLVNDNMNPAPEKVTIEIKSNSAEFNSENSKIWSFGTDKGYIGFLDQKTERGRYKSRISQLDLVSKTPGTVGFVAKDLRPSDQVIIMLATKENLNGIVSDKTFKSMKDTAFIGSDYKASQKDERSFFKKLIDFLLRNLLRVLLFFLGFWSIFSKLKKEKFKDIKKVDFGSRPYNKESVLHYGLSTVSSATNHIPGIKKSNRSKVLSAMFLKWTQEQIMKIEGEDKNLTFTFLENKPKDEVEVEVYDLLTSKGNVLTSKDIKKIFSQYSESLAKLLNGDITKDERYSTTSWGRHTLTEEGKDLLIDVRGAYKFLEEFTLIEEKEIRDLDLWENYLVEATLFGMPKEIMDSLKKAVPESVNMTAEERAVMLDNINYTMLVISNMTDNLAGLLTDMSKLNAINDGLRFLGGGGISSSGGGGGFSGGGSGGGSR